MFYMQEHLNYTEVIFIKYWDSHAEQTISCLKKRDKRDRALDKRDYLMIIFLISHRNYML